MSHDSSYSRRQFLKGALAATCAIGAPMIIPSSALGRDGATAPSERLTIGIIGLGMLGRTAHLPYLLDTPDYQVLALCDVDSTKLDAARKLTEEKYAEQKGKGMWKGVLATAEFREVLARPDIDAVFVVTPDNWHAIVAIEAARAGKDIYCEKPLAMSIGEARAMVQAVRRYGRVLQTGSQQRSDKTFRFACELVRNGKIGKVHTVHVNVGGPPIECFLPAQAVPPTLDWERWLGPAPWRPFNATLAPPITSQDWPFWRYYREYGGGGMCDFGAHHYDIAQWGLGMDHTGPVEIIPPDGKEFKMLTYRYANGVVMTHGGAPEEAAVEFVGDKGTVSVNRGDYIKTTPEGLVNEKIGPNDIHLYKSDSQHANFLECVRTRRRPICDVEIGARSATICHLGNIAYRLNRPLRWDPERERFINDAEADRMILRPMRAPWTI